MKIKLENITDFSKEQQFKIRDWRNSSEVSQYFIIDYITEEMHTAWLERQKEATTDCAFFLTYEGKAVGCVYIRLIDHKHKTAEWGFFMSSDDSTVPGIGAIAEYLLHEYAFNVLKLEKLNIEVLANNPAVLKLHTKFGYTPEGVLRRNIVKNNERLDVHLLGLFADEWENIKSKFDKILAKYKGK